MNETESHGADGMSGLPIMPFPFLNPGNWAAITPPRALTVSLFLLRCGLDNWRHLADAWQASLREQQDAMLAVLEHAPDPAEPAPAPAPLRPKRRRASSAAKQQPAPAPAASAPS